MLFERKFRNQFGAGVVSAGALSVGVWALFAAVHPAAAATLALAAQSAVTCAVTGTSACVSGTNTSSGVGVYGTSNSGTGVRGLSKSNFGLKATSTSAVGVFGGTTSGTAGVEGSATNTVGVYGITSSGGTGVLGTASGSGTGMSGVSGDGYGVSGSSSDGYGLYGSAYGSGTAAYLNSNSGYGLITYSAGSETVYARNSAGNAGDFGGTYIGLVGRAPASGGYPLVLTDSNSNDVFYVDGAGNVSYHGSLSSFIRTGSGASVKAFSPRTTAPTVEDTGSAQLVGGTAVVRLDPAFAATIDSSSAYRVFVTPNGDTHGLYVAAKTPNGFVVRESQAGRSTVGFDYRIIATAIGATGQRMAVANANLDATAPRALAPRVPVIRAAALPAGLRTQP